MAVISISLNEKLIEELNYIEKNLGYSGRSEIIRSALRSFISEKENEKMIDDSTSYTGTIITVSNDIEKNKFHDVEKKFESITRTHIHQCVNDGKCMNVFIVEGKGKILKDFVSSLIKIPKLEFVKLIIAI